MFIQRRTCLWLEMATVIVRCTRFVVPRNPHTRRVSGLWWGGEFADLCGLKIVLSLLTVCCSVITVPLAVDDFDICQRAFGKQIGR